MTTLARTRLVLDAAGTVSDVRHLDDEDLDAIGVLLEERILHEIHEMEKRIMATLDQVLADEQAEGGEITDLVNAFNAQSSLIADLQAQIAALEPGTLTAEQQSQVDQTFAQAELNKQAISAVLPPAVTPVPTPAPEPTPTPAPFVEKIDGESFADYTARVDAWNADPANVDSQIVAPDEATWDALPVG